MSEIVFILDASALARKFYDDIGKSNIDKIFSYPKASYYTHHIGIIETCSALLSAHNAGSIDYHEYSAAISVIRNMIDKSELNVISFNEDLTKEAILVLEQYKTQPGKSFNGIDALYIILSREIAKLLEGEEAKIIFVTSDKKLFNASKDETLFDTFHFWTCNFKCGCESFLPSKGKKDRPPTYKKCNECGNKVEISEAYTSPNTCPHCGSHCTECKYDLCPSTYVPNFENI